MKEDFSVLKQRGGAFASRNRPATHSKEAVPGRTETDAASARRAVNEVPDFREEDFDAIERDETVFRG